MDLKRITEEVLKYWQENEIEKKVLETDKDTPKQRNKEDYPLQFNFYDGPPFASGDPHYGHLLASTIKDLVPRYMYMRGYFVPRKWGWDCHGLPAEGYVEKLLGIRGKKEIEEKIGIEKFVEACRFSVMQVNENWKRFVSHLGRWVDMIRAYFTMDLDFMESVIWVFSDMYKKNFIYKSFKIQGYCPNCATPLSAYEISQGYADKQDKAITVKFKIRGKSEKDLGDLSYTDDGFVEVVAGVVKKDNKYLLLYHPLTNLWTLPGGKVEKGESLEEALKREIREELGVNIKEAKYIGSFKKIINGNKYKINYFDVDVEEIDKLQIQEPEKHSQMAWVEAIPVENELGFGVKINLDNGENIIIDDPNRIKKEFIDIYMLNYVFKKITDNSLLGEAPVYFLAWTTTPWTLPSNMFLAVNPEIDYVLIFDTKTKEYYILAKDLLKRYYKNPEEYIEIYTVKGKDLIDIQYEPLFDYYIKAPNIPEKYKKAVFRVLPGDFVSTESGTGIVHIAPAFGEDDWNIVVGKSLKKFGKESEEIKDRTYEGKCENYDILGEECVMPIDSSNNLSSLSSDRSLFVPETANEWLFLPLNEYAEFTELVPDYQGLQVFEANDKIIQDLKNRGLVVKVESITHSYPHCRRCDTPLIYRAIDSRFIAVNKKEYNFKEKLLKEAEEIYFVPEAVKNRFKKGIEQAPDWNISRNRYWGAPLPVWEEGERSGSSFSGMKEIGREIKDIINKLDLKNSIYDEKYNRIVVGALDDLYKLSKTGSKNITRLVLQRHGETDYNVKHWADSLGEATLTERGWQQAQSIAQDYMTNFKEDFNSGEYVLVVSPLQRTFQTITPLIKNLIGEKESFEDIKAKYYKVVELYQYLWKNHIKDLIGLLQEDKTLEDINDSQLGNIIDELKNSGIQIISSVIYKISKEIPLYVDFRITDHITPSIQGKPFDCHTIQFNDKSIANDPNGESALDVFNRVVNAAKYWTENNFGKTVVLVSHGDPIVMIRKELRNFDRKARKYDFYPSRGEYKIHYIREKLPNEDEVIDFVKEVFSKLVEKQKAEGKQIDIDFSKLRKARLKEVDLHRPYVDKIWFNIREKKFERIKEILDCWFESGSMPYGQDHYPFKD